MQVLKTAAPQIATKSEEMTLDLDVKCYSGD